MCLYLAIYDNEWQGRFYLRNPSMKGEYKSIRASLTLSRYKRFI